MPAITQLVPRQPAPLLEVQTVQGGVWRLADRHPKNFTMISVYRGLHCPICASYLQELDRKLEDFSKCGVEVIALSTDENTRAEKAFSSWKLNNLVVGYGLKLDTARSWGLYVSSGRENPSASIKEPSIFVEPGLFLIQADGTVYMAAIQTMPFARPHIEDILAGITFAIDHDYPARGEIISE